MDLASRIVSVLLGLAVVILFLWPVTIPVGFGEAWWARQQIASRSEPAPPQSQAKTPPPEAQPAPPASGVAPPAPASAAAPAATSAHAVVPDVGDGKRTLLASEKAEAERLAALKGKDAKDTAAATPAPATKRYYKVLVRDGGTLESGGIVIRLAGIAARDADATCKGKNGKAWRCGAAAKSALAHLIHARAVTCELPKTGEQKDFAARCTVAGTDLSTWMVRQGWATPKEPPDPKLADAAAAARSERAGLWREVE